MQPDGSVDCWGKGSAAMDPTGLYTQVSAGYNHNCALKVDDNSVNCWGGNDFGQATDQVGPYTQVSAGDYHTCALRTDGSVHC